MTLETRQSNSAIDWSAVWHAHGHLENDGNIDGADAIRAMHAEITRMTAALRQIADGKVRPRPDANGWYSTAYAVRMVAREALDGPEGP